MVSLNKLVTLFAKLNLNNNNKVRSISQNGRDYRVVSIIEPGLEYVYNSSKIQAEERCEK